VRSVRRDGAVCRPDKRGARRGAVGPSRRRRSRREQAHQDVETLRAFDVSPRPPAGCATMLVVALLPPLWRQIMGPRVLAHHGGDATPANRGPRPETFTAAAP
jgi:hypothetical protein